jgi:hypothetical protein
MGLGHRHGPWARVTDRDWLLAGDQTLEGVLLKLHKTRSDMGHGPGSQTGTGCLRGTEHWRVSYCSCIRLDHRHGPWAWVTDMGHGPGSQTGAGCLRGTKHWRESY